MAVMPSAGTEFAGYRLVWVVSQGEMSTLFLAEDPYLGAVIALKVLLADDDASRTRFLEESSIAASMNQPNVIPIYDIGSGDGLVYIAMRCATGTDLRKLLQENGRLAAGRSVFLIGQAARALDAAHRHGLVHRGIKPANLLIVPGADGSARERKARCRDHRLPFRGLCRDASGVAGGCRLSSRLSLSRGARPA